MSDGIADAPRRPLLLPHTRDKLARIRTLVDDAVDALDDEAEMRFTTAVLELDDLSGDLVELVETW